MKYAKALDKKGLTKTDLSKSIQDKIKNLEYLGNKLKSVNIETLDDSGLEEYEDAKKLVQNIDQEVAELINKFDPEVYKVQKSKAEKMAQARANKTQKVEAVAVEPKVAEEPKVAVEPKKEEESEKINKKLEEIKGNIQVSVEGFQEQTQNATPTEVEDLGKFNEIKPRKMSLGWIVAGVGALLLTGGCVMIFKDKR
jgi:CHASE3 domain sensor protein